MIMKIFAWIRKDVLGGHNEEVQFLINFFQDTRTDPTFEIFKDATLQAKQRNAHILHMMLMDAHIVLFGLAEARLSCLACLVKSAEYDTMNRCQHINSQTN